MKYIYKKNYEKTDNPDFWYQYEWGNQLSKDQDQIIVNRNKFLIDYQIDTERKLDPRYYPEGWTPYTFNKNGNGSASSGEIFYLKDSNNMISIISCYIYSAAKFNLPDYKVLEYPLYSKSVTYYKVAPEEYREFSELSDDLMDLLLKKA